MASTGTKRYKKSTEIMWSLIKSIVSSYFARQHSSLFALVGSCRYHLTKSSVHIASVGTGAWEYWLWVQSHWRRDEKL